ncbi:MAG: hypothetical protein E5X43_02915, partial [Mesorhizobium sp.]
MEGGFRKRSCSGDEHDPGKWKPVSGRDHAQGDEHDPGKWKPVSGKDHAQGTRAMRLKITHRTEYRYDAPVHYLL